MIEVDVLQVLKMFTELKTSKLKAAHRKALKTATQILVAQTKKNFRLALKKKANSRNRWNGRTFISGIKSKINRDATEGKVHIMGDFRLKFFEMGVDTRYKKDGSSTGKIKAYYFFRKARSEKESEISNRMNDIIAQSIKKVYEKSGSGKGSIQPSK